MNVAPDAPKRPALRYYGGKFKLAPWIISHFPKHLNYVEPCGGAASVLLQKPRSPLETYNDLDGNVVNFFRVLRDQPDELIRKIRLTPWAREEYEDCLQPCDEPIEKARRFFVSLWMSMHGGLHEKTSKAWRVSNTCVFADGAVRLALGRTYMENTENELSTIAARLLHVQFENRDAQDVITKYDNADALIYFDPPYVTETRAQGDIYRLETDNDFHIEAAALLRQCAGYVVISGYACTLYTDLYESHGWQRVDKEAQTNSGGKRIESLWLSPRTWRALRDNHDDLPLFA